MKPPEPFTTWPTAAVFWFSLSHVCSDAITEAGVPWLFPFSRRRLALPRLLAIRTGGWAEGLVVVGVLAGVGWWVA